MLDTSLRHALGVIAAGALAACAQTGTPQPAPAAATAPAPAASTEPLTAQRAKELCWMKFENDKRLANNLDKRAALVDQCVTEKMAGRPGS